MSRFAHVFGRMPAAGNGGFAGDGEFLIDTLPDAAFVLDPAGLLLAVNAETARRLGWERAGLQGKCLYDLLPSEVSAVFKEKIAELLETQRPVFYESRQGGRVIDSHLYPVRGADDRIGRIVVLGRDVTDFSSLRATEEALRKSEEKYHILVNEAAEMLFLHDIAGRICEVNRAAVEGTGYTREELLGFSVYDIDHEAAVRNDYEQLWLGLQPGSRACIEARHWRKDGSSYPAEVRLGKVTFDGQDYILALASDISDRKLAEQKQQESEQRMNPLLANLPGMAYRCANDPDWTMQFVSEGAESLTGYTREQLIGREGVRYASLIHPADRRYVWSAIQEALLQDRAFTLEYRIHTAGGEEKWVWEKGRCIDEFLLEGFITDISERKRFEQAVAEKTSLENQLHRLQKTDSINRMAGAVAHHFNNKLSGVLASLELVQIQARAKGCATESIEIAIEAATQAADISRLMLTCLGHSRLERRHVDLPTLCRELRPVLASTMPVTVTLELMLPEERLDVWADAEALRQIVGHLVANAWEAEGTTRVGLRVARMHPGSFGNGIRNPIDWMPADGAYVVIEVTDDGAGISATMVEQIFDPFFSTKFTGRGIGLPLVLGLARSHGGGVIVDSKAGEGTVFRVCLPSAGDAAPFASARAAAKRPAEEPGSGVVTILLVEDEAPLRELAGMMIQSLGGRVISAKDGKEALENFEQHRAEIDLVFCDIRMPGLDGWQVLARLRKMDRALPVVFATAYDDAAISPEGHVEQPEAVLRKPYLLKDIQGVLDRFAK